MASIRKRKGISRMRLIVIALVVLLMIVAFIAGVISKNGQTTSITTPTAVTQDSREEGQLYENNKYTFQLKYPSDLELQEKNIQDPIDGRSNIDAVLISAKASNIALYLLPNTRKISVESWLDERKQEEIDNCQIDCRGFSNGSEKVMIGNRTAILQNLGGVISTVNVYLPLNPQTIIWASASTKMNPVVSDETKALLLSILNSLKSDSSN